jgi:hypothetical protein
MFIDWIKDYSVNEAYGTGEKRIQQVMWDVWKGEAIWQKGIDGK